MDVNAVLGILGLVGIAFTTLWETGGRNSLRRRSIKQELDLMKDLPASSHTRTRLAGHINEEIDLYLYRLRDQPPPGYARAGGIVVVSFIVLAAVRAAFPHPDVAVMYIVEGAFIATVVGAYAVFMRTWWVRRRRKRRGDLLEASRAGPAPVTDR